MSKPKSPLESVVDGVMDGETPLQRVARSGELPGPTMRSIERFPYYSAFPFGWYRAAYSEDVGPGELRPVRYLNRDLVVWRGEDGAAHVMDAYCPHLGAHLGYGGRVQGCEIVCPFHWWQFDGNGVNTKIPYDGSRNAAAKIPSYPTVDRNGFVLFWYHPRGEAPLWEIPELEVCSDAGWTDYDHYRWPMRAPWQEFAENGPDYVHLRTVHGSVDIPEVETYELDGYLTKLRAKVNFDTPRGAQAGRIDTDGWGPGFSIARFSGIIDAYFVACSTPIDFETTEVSHSYKIKKLGSDAAALRRTQRVGEALVRDLTKQVEEDLVILDRKICQMRPRLAKGDGPIAQFRNWAAQFYVEGDPRGVNA
jgi:nitrite reductase/ring-hydroxylating ferredoxin subunit